MTVTAIHTEIYNDDGTLAGHITLIDDNGKHIVRSQIPSEDLDITQILPYESYASSRYATMVQKIRVIAESNETKK